MITLRPSTTADAPALEGLYRRSYGTLLKGAYALELLEAALPLLSRPKPELLGSGTYFVALQGEAIVGAGGFTHAAPGTGDVTPHRGHIRHVATDPSAVKQGIGRALMSHIIATTRAGGLQTLDCASTLTAFPFYEAMGFEFQSEIEIPFTEDIRFPAAQMIRAL